MKPGHAILRLLLAAALTAVVFADFFAPYSPETQHRDWPLSKPAFLDPTAPTARFFLTGTDGKAHLFGSNEPGRPYLLLGSDSFGRDIWSRLIHGGRVSIGAGLLATALSLGIGLLIGALAGFLGGWADRVLMRLTELFIVLPWLYVLLLARAFLPLSLDPRLSFFAVMGVIGVAGWAKTARLIRGQILSSKERDFVHAARMFGAPGHYIFRRHILPFLVAPLATQAALMIPAYALAEVTLSFLGLGVAEPAPSWGNVLAPLRQLPDLLLHPWLALPLAFVAPLLAAANSLALGVERNSKEP